MNLLASRVVADREAAEGGQHAKRTGRSWWSLRYLDGRLVHEWDPDPGAPNGHQDWPRLASLGLLRQTHSLRLYCPNGRMAHAELPNGGDATGRLFQFKRAVRHVVLGGDGRDSTVQEREVLAHVIGVVVGLSGECLLFAWEPLPPPEPPAGIPPDPRKPNYGNREQPAWALREQHERYMAERDAYERFLFSEPVQRWRRACVEWERSGKGRLAGPIADNVYRIGYDGIGPLKADHLGLSDGEGR